LPLLLPLGRRLPSVQTSNSEYSQNLFWSVCARGPTPSAARLCGFERSSCLPLLVASRGDAYTRSPHRTLTKHTRIVTWATVLSCVEVASAAVQCGLALADSTVVLAYFAHAHPSVGQRILVRGRITPFDGPRNPGEPDERFIQYERGYTANLQGPPFCAISEGRHWMCGF